MKNKKRIIKFMLLIIFVFTICVPIVSNAKGLNVVHNLAGKSSFSNNISSCEGILGDVNNENDVAWLIHKIFNYIKILGPILVILLSSIDFIKAIVASDQASMQKAQKKLITRLLVAVLLFLIPTIVELLLDIFGITGSCNIY